MVIGEDGVLMVEMGLEPMVVLHPPVEEVVQIK
jgi:hypothetical protein